MKLRRLPRPAPLPSPDQAAAREFFAGMWHGIAGGCVIGACAMLIAIQAGVI